MIDIIILRFCFCVDGDRNESAIRQDVQMVTGGNNLSSFDRVAHSRSAAHMNILPGASLAPWEVDRSRVEYQRNDRHTLSLYLSGGETSYRMDKAASKGAPGTLCLMPQGHDSHWQINGKVEFVHLYFTDEALKQFAAITFDSDVRCIEFKDLLYQKDDTLGQLITEQLSLSVASMSRSPLHTEQAFHNVMHHLLQKYNVFHLSSHNISGGLIPLHMRRVKDAIHAHLSENLSLEKLARLVDLSPFHFSRMFKLSIGDSPANYITRIRIERVKSLLDSSMSIAEISLQTGFSHQSHMTRNFKKLTGMTPAVYRRHLLQ